MLNSVAKGLGLALLMLCLLLAPQPSCADWICDGDRLSVEITRGAVDLTGLAEGIPNTLEGTLPGDGVLLRWRDVELQLPRTNNAGAPVTPMAVGGGGSLINQHRNFGNAAAR